MIGIDERRGDERERENERKDLLSDIFYDSDQRGKQKRPRERERERKRKRRKLYFFHVD